MKESEYVWCKSALSLSASACAFFAYILNFICAYLVVCVLAKFSFLCLVWIKVCFVWREVNFQVQSAII